MRVGITCGFSKEENRIILNRAYIDFVHKYSGEPPVIIYPTTSIPYVRDFDVVVLSGGPDVNPTLYGEATIDADKCDYERDLFELELVKELYLHKVPTLGICRGAQIMGVYLGENLKQHINTHSQPHERGVPCHHVILSRKGREIFKEDTIRVNSMHHQCVNACINPKNAKGFITSEWAIKGDDLLVLGVADDGVCEMFISKKHNKFLGLQWHPEELPKYNLDKGDKIFNYLLEEV